MVTVPEHTMDEVPLQEDDEKTIEYRMFMVYAQRSLPESKFSALQRAASPRGDPMAISNGKEEKAKAEAKLADKEHKKKGWPRKLTPACLRPPKSKKKINGAPGEKTAKDSEEEKARSIISRVQQIVRRIKQQEKENGYRMVRRVSSIQQDGDDEDEIIANIVHILRTTGDQLNDQIIKEKTLVEKIKGLWSYDFYKRVTDCFLSETVTIADTEEEQQKSKIALCLHATTALTTLDNQPMNKVLGFGAQYLRENYSPWIQSRGGWEKVMGIETDEEEIE